MDMLKGPAPQKKCAKCSALIHIRKTNCPECGGKRFTSFAHIHEEEAKEADGDSDNPDSDEDGQESDGESDDASAKKKSESDGGSSEDSGDLDSDGDGDDGDNDDGGGNNKDSDSCNDENSDDDDSDDDDNTKPSANIRKLESSKNVMAKARELEQKRRDENPDMIPFWPGPRSTADLQAGHLSKVGSVESTRDGADLRAREHFEINGLVPVKLLSQPNAIVYTCLDCYKNKKGQKKRKKKRKTSATDSASLCLRIRWGLDISTGEWLCTCINLKCCNGQQVRRTRGATGPKTTAYLATQLAPLLVPHVSNTGKLTPKVAMPHLGAVCARALSISFVKNVIKLAKEAANFGCAEQEEDAVKELPCVLAALNDCGFIATMKTTDSTEIRRLCLEVAKADHSRAEEARQKKCKKTGDTFVPKRFDAEDLPEIDDSKKYLCGYTLAPKTGQELYKHCPFKVLSADFCHTTDHGAPNGVLGSVYGHDANNALVDIGEYQESELFF